MFRRLAPYLVFAFYWLWTMTWKKRVYEPESFRSGVFQHEFPVIFAIWHGDELAILGHYRRYSVATMTSTSKDGELMYQVLKLMGIESSRGSSTRGGVGALKGLIRLAKTGRIPLIPVDGPRGPIHRVKPGIFELSRALGAKIIPAGVACSRAKVFEKSWNKSYLPLPFSTLQLVWGEPLDAIGKDQDPRDPIFQEKLEAALRGVKQQALKMIAEGHTTANLIS